MRGYRIEPGEIAAVLTTHPDVKDAAVVARADAAGERQLVAYLVPGAEADAGGSGGGLVSGVRGFLGERVPSYMVPPAFKNCGGGWVAS